MNSNGIEEFFNTGDMLGTILTDVFSDVNIYDDDIRLLQRRFVSPIGRGAISFYKFYLMDTLMVDKQECVHLTFVPQNPQDFGFTGHLYVVKDSTYAVKKCRDEPAQEDGRQLRGEPRHRAAVRATARRQLGAHRRRHDRGTRP